MKLVDEAFELITEKPDTFVLSLGPKLVLENNCDEDDMQSNISLEEDVNDLNQKVGKE